MHLTSMRGPCLNLWNVGFFPPLVCSDLSKEEGVVDAEGCRAACCADHACNGKP